MGFNPAHRIDQARRAKHESEQLRRLRTRPHGHAEAKTFVLEGAVDETRLIPPVFIGLDPDNTIPEVKFVYEFGGVLDVGTLDGFWSLNGTPITGGDLTITTDPDDAITVLATQVPLTHRDRLQLTITAVSGASDLAAVVYMVTRQA